MPAIKFLFFCIAIFASDFSFSQKAIENYYDYNWHQCLPDDARFYSISKTTDSGWYKADYFLNLRTLQMAGLYVDKENTIRNGTFYYFYPNNTLKSVGKYSNNKKTGVWLDYFPDNSLKNVLNFKDGHSTGISLGWYSDGTARDSLNIDDNGNGVYVSWFDNGNPSSAGKYFEFRKQGKWQYFHKNGKLSALEIYDHDVLKDKNYFNEDGNPVSDTTSIDRDVQFTGGEKAWNKYLVKNLHFPSGLEFRGSHQAVVLVTGTINEDGKVIDVEVSAPLSPAFDKIAVEALRDSPKWIPAISHNRKVYDTFSFALNFSQGYY